MLVPSKTKKAEKLYYREALEEALRILKEDKELVEEIRKIAEEAHLSIIISDILRLL